MDFRKIIGGVLIFLGILALLHNLEILEVNSPLVVSLVMLFLGGICFRFYFVRERSLWLLIIAFLTFFWGLGIFLYELRVVSFPIRNHFLFFGIGLSFIAIYFYNTKNWWAVIPGGILCVLFFVDLLDEFFYLERGTSGFLIFFGIGLIFLYLYLIRDEENRLLWAIYPAVGLIVLGFLQLYFSTHQSSVQIGVAIILILLGSFLIFRPGRRIRPSPSIDKNGGKEPPLPQDSQPSDSESGTSFESEE